MVATPGGAAQSVEGTNQHVVPTSSSPGSKEDQAAWIAALVFATGSSSRNEGLPLPPGGRVSQSGLADVPEWPVDAT